MEFSEAFRTEDISKTDFFDFVVTPEDMGNDIVLHNNFPAWSRKSVGLFANNNNNNSSTEDLHGDPMHPPKEANNNVLPNFADDSFWDTGGAKAFAAAAASVNIKMESPTLEDINDICWPSSVGVASVGDVATPERTADSSDQRLEEQDGDGNTDGSIYTLTVVNGQEAAPQGVPQGVPQAPAVGAPPPGPGAAPEPPPLWYRPPDLASILREGSMASMDADQTSLDIDSIISILPSLPSMAESLHGHGLFNGDTGHPDDLLASTAAAACDDSGFVESSKEDVKQHPPPTPRSEYTENNNDWAYSNHNDGGHGHGQGHGQGHSTAESLLRSALQGGKSYLNQYNGVQQPHLQQDSKTLTELGPPGQPDHSSLGLFMSGDGMLPPMDPGGGGMLFDDGSAGGMYGSTSASSGCASACTSTTCMDDLLLSPLDDYEMKLKMIENEVAESAKRYAVHHANGLGHGHGHGHGPGHYGAVPSTPVGGGPGPGPGPGTPVPHTSTAPLPSRPKKKAGKRSTGDRPPAKAKSSSSASASSSGGVSSSGGGLSSNGSGARRERSLHHCTICSKAFKDKYSVNVHIRTHTGEKPFACSVCGKSFRQKAHLAKHYHTHIVQKSEHLGPSKAVSTKAR